MIIWNEKDSVGHKHHNWIQHPIFSGAHICNKCGIRTYEQIAFVRDPHVPGDLVISRMKPLGRYFLDPRDRRLTCNEIILRDVLK